MKMGNSTLGIIVGLCSVASSVIAPTLYMSGIKATTDLHDLRLTNVERDEYTSQQDIKNLNTKIDALLWKQGINPQSLISQK